MACSYQLKDSCDFLIKFTPIVISLCVLLVSLHQSKISREKLRLDLYNRRFDIYSRTLDFFNALVSYDASKPRDNFSLLRLAFVKSYRESRFLFDERSGIYEILNGIYKRSFKIADFLDISRSLSNAPDVIQKGLKEKEEALNWSENAIPRLEKSIARYLNFHKIAV